MFERSQIVDLQGVTSETTAIYNGVPQGSILGPLLFILFLNDIHEHLINTKIIKYADDTVLYYSNEDINIIEGKLNEDLENISHYFDSNELIINLKKGKTEAMLFGTSKRIHSKQLSVYYKTRIINFVQQYKYLDNIIDNTLTLDESFSSTYKKVCARVMLLKKIRGNLTSKIAKKIYTMTILPLLTYSSTVHINYNKSQLSKLKSIEKRIASIISDNPLYTIHGQLKIEICNTVRKCLDKNSCTIFQNYFELTSHMINTRNNNLMLRLPTCKINFAKKAFYYSGAKIYNELQIEVGKETKFEKFKHLVKLHFTTMQF